MVSALPKHRNGHGRGHAPAGFSESVKARMFLAVACLWPFWIMALFSASSPGRDMVPSSDPNASGLQKLADRFVSPQTRLNLRNVLDRVDVMGYGPTHPRFAIVIVDHGDQDTGEEQLGDKRDYERLIDTLESVYRHTNLNRIFLICIIVDGQTEDPELVKKLKQIDDGSVPHWHGDEADVHLSDDRKGQNDEAHQRKIHVMFNPEAQGVMASRNDAAEFTQVLVQKHEQAGLKNPQEDILLMLLQSGAQLSDRNWIAPVTSALIVPPPILGADNAAIAVKLANAVVFNIEGAGQRTSVDEQLAPIITDAKAADINLSNGLSYPTPVWNGAALVMRLETYLHLPSRSDESLADEWTANLELSLNLWLCADGMDMLNDVALQIFDMPPDVPLTPEQAARFAAVWMDDKFARKFFQAYSPTMTRLEWETLQAAERDRPTFPKHADLPNKCRSFTWFAEEVAAPTLDAILSEVVPEEEHRQKERAEDKAKAEQEKLGGVVEPLVAGKVAAVAEETKKRVEQIKQGLAHDGEAKVDIERKAYVKPEAKPDIEPKADTEPKADNVAADKKLIKIDDHEPPKDDGDSIPNLAANDKKKPSKPLCKECLEIVQRAKPMDISFVDVSNNNADFPHKGAMDENGNWGYIHDETALRKNPPKLNYEGEDLKRGCTNRDNNYKMLHEKVFVDMEAHNKKEQSGEKRDKIFCLVYTISPGHSKIPNIRETWGPKCDGFMVGSNLTDTAIGAVNIPHEGPEEYNNIWQKVRSMWAYIYDNYYEKYDWFHIGGDDLFLLVENLRLYLESEEIRTAANGGIYLPDGTETVQTPLFLGRRFAYMGDMNDIFLSGGSGYTMNKAAFKALVVDGFPNYFPHAHTFSEDTMVAKILRKMDIYPYDTKDEFGGERYMPFMPGHHYSYRLPPDPMKSKDWYAKYSIKIKEGLDHCAARSVAFHYVKDQSMKRLFVLLYGMCPKEYMES